MSRITTTEARLVDLVWEDVKKWTPEQMNRLRLRLQRELNKGKAVRLVAEGKPRRGAKPAERTAITTADLVDICKGIIPGFFAPPLETIPFHLAKQLDVMLVSGEVTAERAAMGAAALARVDWFMNEPALRRLPGCFLDFINRAESEQAKKLAAKANTGMRF